MTVQTTYTPTTYAGDGTTTAFTIPWAYQYDTDIVAQTTVAATGVVTNLVLGEDYTVFPSAGTLTLQSGTLTLINGALASGTSLTISRSPALDQVSIWTENFANPAKQTENALDKLTMIAQDVSYALTQIGSGGGGGGSGASTVTTAAFTTAAVNASQTIQVSSTKGFNVNNYILVSDGPHSLIAQITAISTPNFTATTLSIVKGTQLGGDTMATGASVQLSQAPSQNTIILQDASTTSGPVSTMQFQGSVGDALANSFGPIYLYTTLQVGGTYGVFGYIKDKLNYTVMQYGTRSFTGKVLAIQPGIAGTKGPVIAVDSVGNNNSLLQVDGSSNILWGPLTANHFTAGLILPSFLNATNSPSNTQVPSYDLASGRFKWVNASGGGVPAGGNAGQFLRGDSGGIWSSFLNTSLGAGAFVFGNSEATNSYAGFVSQANITPSGFNAQVQLGVVKNLAGTWTGDKGVVNIGGAVAIQQGGVLGYTSVDSTNVESLQVSGDGAVTGSGIIRGVSVRSKIGTWLGQFTINNPAASLTVDIANGTYQRITGIATNVTITLADTTPAPISGTIYSNELMLEINAPGAFSFTWPGTVTWANGASAPTLNASGVNLIKLVRRQGQTNWIGYVVNSAAAGGYTDGQAINAIMSPSRLLTSSSIVPTIVTGSSGTVLYNIAPLGVTNTMLAGSIAASKLANFPGTGGVYLDGLGNWTTPSGTGSFSTAQPHTWTATQTFQTAQTFQATNTFAGNVFGSVGTNAVQTFNNAALGTGSFCINTHGYTDGSTYFHGIDLNLQNNFSSANPGAVTPITVTHVYQNPGVGGGTSLNLTQVNAGATTAGNYHATINVETFCTKLNGGDSSAWFIQAMTPNASYSGANDPFYPQVGHHSFTGGTVRVGEVNYGNSWSDFGMSERRGLTNVCVGIELFPQYFGGYPNYSQFDAQWAIAIGNAGQVSTVNSRNACNYIGILIDQDSISPGGYGLKIWGARQNPFNGTTPTANAPASAIKVSGTFHAGLDFSGYATLTSTDSSVGATILADASSQQPAVMLAQGQAICFKPSTGAGTGVYILFDGTHLKATINGGTSYTNII